MPESEPRGIVVVGTGVAGATAALTLRRKGFDGRVVLVGAEPDEPYRRPPLSKDLLRGDMPAARVRLRPPDTWEKQGIELLTGTAVTGFDASTVTLDDGTRLPYDRLLLATGGRPRTLPQAAGLPHVHTLRTLGDVPALREDLESGGRLLVIGAGLIGLEVASTARAMGCEVTVLEAADRALGRVLPPSLAHVLMDVHRAHGVRVHTGAAVRGMAMRGRTVVATGGGGESWAAETVVVAVGIAPETALAEKAGLEVADGIVVDAYGATSAPRVYAAGDVARHPDPVLGGSHRIEHWTHAQEHGAAVAAAMLGAGEPYRAVPYCWTGQYATTLQMAGHPAQADELEVDGDPAALDFTAAARRRGRLIGAVGANRPAGFRDLRDRLADTAGPR